MKQWTWIGDREVFALHDALLALHGGAEGVRDEGLLQSALARPQQILAYGNAPDTMELASAYTAGIVRNHPFVDGNKRTGFVVGILFLELNRCRFEASEEAATQTVLELAAGQLDEEGYTAFLRASTAKLRRK